MMKKLKASKRLTSRNKQSYGVPSPRKVSTVIGPNVLLSLPLELRLDVMDLLDTVDCLVLRWTCRSLRAEVLTPGLDALSEDDRNG